MKHKDLSEFIAGVIKTARTGISTGNHASDEAKGVNLVAWRFADILYKDDEAAKDLFFNQTVEGCIKRALN